MTVTLGPFALPAALLALFAAILLGSAVGNRAAAREGAQVEGSLWLVVAGAVLAARLAFVAQYWTQYGAEPWRIPDLRDGGLTPVAGIAAAVAIGGVLAWRKAAQRRALVIAVAVGLVVYAAGTGLIRMSSQQQALPATTLADLGGRGTTLGALAGKPMVVNIWASWCPPCRREMPALSKAQRDAPDVHFVFVNQGESAAAIRAYLQAEELSLGNVLRDPPGALAKALDVRGLPTTLFFDADGRLVGKRTGELSAATLAEHLDALGSGGMPSTPQSHR